MNGGPAFPCVGRDGVTLRDYFAGQALIGILAQNARSGWSAQSIAGEAGRYADAMLAERERG